MAGVTMFDTATLAAIAQQNSANGPFPMAAINPTNNVGGSVFSPDGGTLYAAFNVAPVVVPAARPQASTLLISDSSNVRVRLGIQMPESIVARLVITSDGT